MKCQNNQLIYSPNDLVRFFESEFVSFMDHFQMIMDQEVLRKKNIYRDPSDPFLDLIKELGNEHELKILEKVKENRDIFRIENDLNKNEGFQKTKSLMAQGVSGIYQASLIKNNFNGYADLILKTEGESKFGSFLYVPVDIKIATNPKPSAIIQLCCYVELLENIQGSQPPYFEIITKNNQYHRYNTSSFFFFYKYLKNTFEDFHNGFEPEEKPIPEKLENHVDWTMYARKRLNELDDVSLTAGIRSSHVEILKRGSIYTMTDLAKFEKESIQGIPNSTSASLKSQAQIQVQSKGFQKPEFKVLNHDGSVKGLERLPPSNKGDIFFDMEGSSILGENGLEYLYGNVINEQNDYISFWSYSLDQERKAFMEWLNWVYARWKSYPGSHIYHYGHYEVSTIKRLMCRYGIGEDKIDHMLENKVFVDLSGIVKQGLLIGTYSYSLKQIEKLYYSERTTDVSSGTAAAERFFQYLNSDQKPEDSPFLKEIIKYNYDDCKSTQQLYKFLIEIQKDYKIQYLFESEEPVTEKRERREPAKSCEEKGKELLNSIPQEKLGLKITETNKEDEKYYLAEILGNLLQFHIREGKVDAWAYYHYLEMDNQEKLDDSSIIANCRFVRSDNFSGLEIHFEPHQDIKHRAGSEVKILEPEGNIKKYKIEEMDLIKGIMKVTGESLASDKVFDLIPHENFFFKSNIYKSLLKTSKEFAFDSKRCRLKKSLYELLTKKKPDIRSHEGSLILNREEIIKQASDHALNLNESVLCIQGPPGTGKTYTAASMILYLIRNNKKVGVTANSHKAIDNVIKEVFKQKSYSDNFKCQRIVSKPKELDFEQELLCKRGVNFVPSGNADYSVRLTGGTSFFFSREQQENGFDYLFVDEASQVSLANLVAASRATKNIILLGDQNQLDQPIKASHPGETGLSVLSYYTNSKRTIPQDKGIFLPVSYRMNPKVCLDVSELFYDDLLSSHESTNKQKLILCKSLKQQVPESGVYHIPVNHLGNEQSSIEEAEEIANLYQYLLECQWIDQEGHTKPITEEDILITAPFNMQVAIIKEELLKKSISNPRVASVDKFQGQEAPVSILSLGASTIKDAPRGIGFLLNKNRINVALSRARCLSIVVASTNLTDIRFNSIENMELMNIFCKIKSKSFQN